MNDFNFWVPNILTAGVCLVCFLIARSAIKSAQRAHCKASEHINIAIKHQLAAQAAQLKAEKLQKEALLVIRDAQQIKNEYTQKLKELEPRNDLLHSRPGDNAV